MGPEQTPEEEAEQEAREVTRNAVAWAARHQDGPSCPVCGGPLIPAPPEHGTGGLWCSYCGEY